MNHASKFKERQMLVPRIYEAIQRRRYRWFYQRKITAELPRGMVSFTFDDFPASAASVAAPILEREGWRGTYYLSPSLMGRISDVGEICTEVELEILLAKGHEIGNHTFSHIRCIRASKSELQREFNLSMQYLGRFSGATHFAFPFGAHDDASQMFFSTRFATLRGVKKGLNEEIFDLNQLRANPIYQTSDLDEIESVIQQASRRRAWAIFYTHDVSPTPSAFGCTQDRFEAVVSIVRSSKLEVFTVGEAYRKLREAGG